MLVGYSKYNALRVWRIDSDYDSAEKDPIFVGLLTVLRVPEKTFLPGKSAQANKIQHADLAKRLLEWIQKVVFNYLLSDLRPPKE